MAPIYWALVILVRGHCVEPRGCWKIMLKPCSSLASNTQVSAVYCHTSTLSSGWAELRHWTHHPHSTTNILTVFNIMMSLKALNVCAKILYIWYETWICGIWWYNNEWNFGPSLPPVQRGDSLILLSLWRCFFMFWHMVELEKLLLRAGHMPDYVMGHSAKCENKSEVMNCYIS